MIVKQCIFRDTIKVMILLNNGYFWEYTENSEKQLLKKAKHMRGTLFRIEKARHRKWVKLFLVETIVCTGGEVRFDLEAPGRRGSSTFHHPLIGESVNIMTRKSMANFTQIPCSRWGKLQGDEPQSGWLSRPKKPEQQQSPDATPLRRIYRVYSISFLHPDLFYSLPAGEAGNFSHSAIHWPVSPAFDITFVSNRAGYRSDVLLWSNFILKEFLDTTYANLTPR